MKNLRLTYIGGPTAIIEFGGLRFLTDPTFDAAGGDYTTGPVTLTKTKGPALGADSVGRIDAVLLSHDHHADNLDRAGRALLGETGRVLTTVDGAARLGGNATGLAHWQFVEIPDGNGAVVRVTATPARHGPAHMDRGPVIGFVLEKTGAGTVYVSGDTVWYEGVQEVAARFDVRLVILFVGAARVAFVGPDHLTMTAAEAVEAARAFPAAKIIPLHYEGWAHFSESRAEVEQAFVAAGLTGRLSWPSPGVPADIAL